MGAGPAASSWIGLVLPKTMGAELYWAVGRVRASR